MFPCVLLCKWPPHVYLICISICDWSNGRMSNLRATRLVERPPGQKSTREKRRNLQDAAPVMRVSWWHIVETNLDQMNKIHRSSKLKCCKRLQRKYLKCIRHAKRDKLAVKTPVTPTKSAAEMQLILTAQNLRMKDHFDKNRYLHPVR